MVGISSRRARTGANRDFSTARTLRSSLLVSLLSFSRLALSANGAATCTLEACSPTTCHFYWRNNRRGQPNRLRRTDILAPEELTNDGTTWMNTHLPAEHVREVVTADMIRSQYRASRLRFGSRLPCRDFEWLSTRPMERFSFAPKNRFESHRCIFQMRSCQSVEEGDDVDKPKTWLEALWNRTSH